MNHPRKRPIKPVTLAQLLDLPIGKKQIVVWIRWSWTSNAEGYYLCKEGNGTVFVVPTANPRIGYSEILLFGTEEWNDRVYLENPISGKVV